MPIPPFDEGKKFFNHINMYGQKIYNYDELIGSGVICEHISISGTHAGTLLDVFAGGGYAGDLQRWHSDSADTILAVTGELRGIAAGTLATSAVHVDQMNTAVSGVGGGVTSHGALTDLLVDDHTQYIRTAPDAISRNIIEPDAAVVPLTISGSTVNIQDWVSTTSTRSFVNVFGQFSSPGMLLQNSKIFNLAEGETFTDAVNVEQMNTAVSGLADNTNDDFHTQYIITQPTVGTRNKITGNDTDTPLLHLEFDDASGLDAPFIVDELGGAFNFNINGLGELNINSATANAIDCTGGKILNLGDGSAADDAAAFGQIITDHGALGGKADDDHTQYILGNPLSSTRNIIEPASSVVPLTISGSTVNLQDWVNGGVRAFVNVFGQISAPGMLLQSSKITGLANGTVSTDAAAFGQIVTSHGGLSDLGVDDHTNYVHMTPVNGTRNKITGDDTRTPLLEIEFDDAAGLDDPFVVSELGGAFTTKITGVGILNINSALSEALIANGGKLTDIGDGSDPQDAITLNQLDNHRGGSIDEHPVYVEIVPDTDARNLIIPDAGIVPLTISGSTVNIQDWVSNGSRAFVNVFAQMSTPGLLMQNSKIFNLLPGAALTDAVNVDQMNIAVSGVPVLGIGNFIISGTVSPLNLHYQLGTVPQVISVAAITGVNQVVETSIEILSGTIPLANEMNIYWNTSGVLTSFIDTTQRTT